MRDQGLLTLLLQESSSRKGDLRLGINRGGHAGNQLVEDLIIRDTIGILEILKNSHQRLEKERLGFDLAMNTGLQFS